ncbi:MAG: hypothetical protein V4556_05370 [Bacteroidota bacterium]
MKKILKISLLFLIAASVTFSSCNSSKKSGCGCPSKKGLSGY